MFSTVRSLAGDALPFDEENLLLDPAARKLLGQFLHQVCGVHEILRRPTADSEELRRDVRILKLQWTGYSTAETLVWLDGTHWDELSSGEKHRARGKLNSAAYRLRRTLHRTDAYSGPNLRQMLERHMAGEAHAVPTRPAVQIVQRRKAIPQARPEDQTAAQKWLEFGGIGRDETDRKLLMAYLLEDVYFDVDAPMIEQGLADLRAKIIAARDYVPPEQASDTFKRAIQLREADTEYLNDETLTMDEDTMLSGFARVSAMRKELAPQTLRRRILHDLRRIVVIPSPDVPPDIAAMKAKTNWPAREDF